MIKNMFWIYVPPIILVGAIIALVIILGRKSAEVKRAGAFQKEHRIESLSSGRKEVPKQIGLKILHFLEKVLILLKLTVKKSEQAIAKLVSNIRARRAGGRPLGISEIESSAKSRIEGPKMGRRGTKIIGEIKKTENMTEWIASEMVVKKKRVEEPVVRLKEMPAPEDKLREEAFIHRIAENPKDVEAYRELGDYYLAVGNIKDAKDSFKMVLKLRPRDLKAKSSLREIEMKMRLGS